MADQYEAHFVWPRTDARDVIVTGTFDNWKRSIHLTKGAKGFENTVKLPWDSKVIFKYIVDGRWVTSQEHATEYDNSGNLNNVLHTPLKPATVELASPVAIGAVPGAAAFRPSVELDAHVPPVATNAATTVINTIADKVQNGVASVANAAQAFAEHLVDQSAVTPVTETPVTEKTQSSVIPSKDDISVQAQEVFATAQATATYAVESAKTALAQQAPQVVDDGKDKAAEAADAAQKVLGQAPPAAQPIADKAAETVEAVKPVSETSTPAAPAPKATTPPAVSMPIVPLGHPIESPAPETLAASTTEAIPVPGASTEPVPQPGPGAIPAEEPSTHAPINLAGSRKNSTAATPAVSPSLEKAPPVLAAGATPAPSIPIAATETPGAEKVPAPEPASAVASEATATTTTTESEKIPEPVPSAAPEIPTTPIKAETKTNGRTTPPKSLPPAASSPPTTPAKNGSPAPVEPSTPGSVRSTTSSSRFGTGSIRKKRESIFGKIKDIFHHDKDEKNGDKKEKKHRRQSSLANSSS